MMNLKTIFFISLYIILASQASYGNSDLKNTDIEKAFFSISDKVIYYWEDAIQELDSLEGKLTNEEFEASEPYFNYIYGCIAYEKARYRKSLLLADQALEYFAYNDKGEWAARCLTLIGKSAEATRLIPEAINAYTLAIEYSKKEKTRGTANINLARNRKRLNLDWTSYYQAGIETLEQCDTKELRLYARLMPSWFYPDSTEIIESLPSLALEYENLNLYTRAADAYKSISNHHKRRGDYQKALYYIDLSLERLDMAELSPKFLKSSAHQLKGQILFLTKKDEEGYNELLKSIEINNSMDSKDNHNYNLYQYLYKYEYNKGNYKKACLYLNNALSSYKTLAATRTDQADKMSSIFKKIRVVRTEIEKMRRKANHLIIYCSILSLCIFACIAFWLISRKNHYEKKSADMEVSNQTLRAETGKLLVTAKQNKEKESVIATQIEIESKVNRLIPDEDKSLPSNLSEKYVETLLVFNRNLKMLTQTERRYAAMIALDVPSKDIAELLSVKTQTVAQYRNRIRKKTGLTGNKTDLKNHLMAYIEK